MSVQGAQGFVEDPRNDALLVYVSKWGQVLQSHILRAVVVGVNRCRSGNVVM